MPKKYPLRNAIALLETEIGNDEMVGYLVLHQRRVSERLRARERERRTVGARNKEASEKESQQRTLMQFTPRGAQIGSSNLFLHLVKFFFFSLLGFLVKF